MHIIRYSYPASRSLGSTFRFSGRSPWSGLEGEIDRLFETAMGSLASPSGNRFPVDLYEDKNNTYVRAELPGVAREDIAIEMTDGVLSIQATRKQKEGEQEQSVSFSRSVSIPDEVVADKVSAAYENGVLTVTLPKKEESKPRKIAISVN